MAEDCYHDICLDEPECVIPPPALATCDVCGWTGPEAEFNAFVREVK